MSGLNQHRNSVFQLQSVWDNLSLLAQLSGTGTDMTQTRGAFGAVTNDVIEDLSQEMLKKAINRLASKAYVTINIVIRNLFERTADIGFLATDDDIRVYLNKYLNGGASASELTTLVGRFDEYAKKYSVYSNIILLDTEGNVLAQLDNNSAVVKSVDPLISQSIQTDQAYVETYRYSDLLPNQEKSLIYSYRVNAAGSGQVLGVLCLCFRFEDEMEGVFHDLIAKDDWAVGVMLDKEQRVIASSDQYQIPLGAKLEVTQETEDWILTRFAGREYIAVTRKTSGYQGYMGPGWLGHAMIPLEQAFEDDLVKTISRIDRQLLAKVMRSPSLFSQRLLGIPKQAATIQSKLNQSVWNGNIWQTKQSDVRQNSFSKALLWEISNTGFKTQNVIETTVTELYQTVVSVMLENSSFFAFLAVDIMDRNLYERANDCRWWALTTSFREILSKPARSSEHLGYGQSDISSLEKTIKYINQLYTVYENLVIFDRNSKVLACSNSNYGECVGAVIESEWVGRVRSLRSSQEYVVSKFEPSPLYKGNHTYIYAAPIRSVDNTSIVGGIGIVFDSQPQFKAILNDIVPRDENGKIVNGCFTLFVDGNLKIISSSSKEFAVGSEFKIHPVLCKMNPGDSAFDIAVYQGDYYAIGARASSGYREYKGVGDDYKNQMTAMIFIPLGNAESIDALIKADLAIQHNEFKPNSTSVIGSNTKEYATFYIGSQWLGLPTNNVVEAIQNVNVRSIPDTISNIEGVFQYEGKVIPVINLGKMMGMKNIQASENMQMIVIQANESAAKLAILVNALGEIPPIDQTKIEPITNIFNNSKNNVVVGVTPVATNDGESKMLTVLSAENLLVRSNAQFERDEAGLN
jgi:chemotaxis signal transduction protein